MDVQNSMTPYSGKLQINDSDLSRIEVFFVLFVLSHSATSLFFNFFMM